MSESSRLSTWDRLVIWAELFWPSASTVPRRERNFSVGLSRSLGVFFAGLIGLLIYMAWHTSPGLVFLWGSLGVLLGRCLWQLPGDMEMMFVEVSPRMYEHLAQKEGDLLAEVEALRCSPPEKFQGQLQDTLKHRPVLAALGLEKARPEQFEALEDEFLLTLLNHSNSSIRKQAFRLLARDGGRETS